MARWDWTEADLEKALERASKGKGAQLAKLIKATSEEDLTAGLSRSHFYLPSALYFCLGRREQRRYHRELLRKSPLLKDAEIRVVGGGGDDGCL